MRLGFEKARKREQAHPKYDPIASFKPPVRFKRRRKFHKHNPNRQLNPVFAGRPNPPKDMERVLTIEPKGGAVIFTRWRCVGGKWKCITADPQVEWFLRVRHCEVVLDWLFKNHHAFHWHPAKPVCTAHKPQTESNPAEDYTPLQASDSTEVNTVVSLNTQINDALRGQTPQATSLLEPTGVTSPCGLIRPQTAPTP